jgi:hypothetical protein
MHLQMHPLLPPLSLSCMYLPEHWLELLLVQYALIGITIGHSELPL